MMNHEQMTATLNFIRPNAKWSLSDLDLIWLDEEQKEPTKKELEDGLVAYQAKINADKLALENQKQAILDRLGITSDEAKLLLS